MKTINANKNNDLKILYDEGLYKGLTEEEKKKKKLLDESSDTIEYFTE